MKKLIVPAVLAAALLAASPFAAEGRDWSEIYFAESPSVSPDGSFFVFAWCGRIWRAPTSGGTAVPLDDGTSSDSSPCISPDGRRVAFLSNRTGTDQLFEIELGEDGLSASGTRQLTWHTQSLSPFGYTADGKRIVAAAYRDNASESVTCMRASRRAILVRTDERAAEELLFDAQAWSPALSPDGTKVLFVSRFDGGRRSFRKRRPGSTTAFSGDIWLYDRAKREFTPVVVGRDGAYDPVWTPDGGAFYYLSDAGGVRNVRRRDLASGDDRAVTAFSDDHVFEPSLSRDGRTMVFAKGFDLWRIDPTAESPVAERIALRPAGFDPTASCSRRRKYTIMDNNYGSGNCTFRAGGAEAAFTAGGDLWVMDMPEKGKEGREPTLVHGSSRTHERDCAFSPDGEALYYLSDRGDGTDVWRAGRSDTNKLWCAHTDFVLTRLTSDDVCRRLLSVSPDGRLLAWTDLTGRLAFADTNGVVRHVSPVACTDCQSYVWSPDGRYVAAALRDGFGNCDVWIIPTEPTDAEGNASPEPCNVSRNYKWDGDPAWSPDGRMIAFSGVRTATGPVARIYYAYLDPEDEAHEKAGRGVRKEPCRVTFEGLPDRVRPAGHKGEDLFFGPDSRTLAFSFGDKVWKITLPDSKGKDAKEMFKKKCYISAWPDGKDGGTPLGTVNNRPARGDEAREFTVFQTTDVADYQELAFLCAWADVRDGFCDPKIHGADWPAVREKYILAARNAPAWSVFARTVKMMHGEIDGSHLGFWANNVTKERWLPPVRAQGWTLITAHLGARFDPEWKGEGWRVRDVVQDSPADRGREGLLAGDIVLSVDGRKVSPGMDYSEAMNTYLPHKFRLSVMREGETNVLEREVEAIAFTKVRQLLRAQEVSEARRRVRERGNFGYLAIDAMRDDAADEFADAVFAECFGKDGVVIDVRYNTGGHTADRLIDILCGNRHARTLSRGVEDEGYLISRFGRPVITSLPVVVLANERSQSNAEEFSHAMKTLGRAKVVGMETAGDVIGTLEFPLLDYGVTRRPRVGFFLPDGTDMEGHGATPDVEVDLTPADAAAGRDPQLDAALDVLAEEAAACRAAPPPPLDYYR